MNEYIQITNNIRYTPNTMITGYDQTAGKLPELKTKQVYDFEVFRRPFFFGIFGRKRWVYVRPFNSVGEGIEYCERMI